MIPRVVLGPGRERSVLRRHPWVWSGSVARIDGVPENGAVVDVHEASGAFLARGTISNDSQIRVRLLTWDRGEAIDDAFWRGRIERAVAARAALSGETDACRLVHAEGDGIPGLIVDRYGPWLVVQLLSAGVERHRDPLIAALTAATGARGIWERSDTAARALEGLEPRCGRLAGEEPPPAIEIGEHGLRLLVDPHRGQKTGFYLDQRENRRRAARWLGAGVVLNAYAYTGSFALVAARAGASQVVSVDSSADSLALGQRQLELNGLLGRDDRWIEADVGSELRRMRDRGETFDAAVVDPPKFARGARQVDGACRAYKDVNLLAMKLLRPGGTLITFSCSGAIDELLFRKVLHGAAIDARRELTILDRLAQGADHPVRLSFPEGSYLKGLILRVDPSCR